MHETLANGEQLPPDLSIILSQHVFERDGLSVTGADLMDMCPFKDQLPQMPVEVKNDYFIRFANNMSASIPDHCADYITRRAAEIGITEPKFTIAPPEHAEVEQQPVVITPTEQHERSLQPSPFLNEQHVVAKLSESVSTQVITDGNRTKPNEVLTNKPIADEQKLVLPRSAEASIDIPAVITTNSELHHTRSKVIDNVVGETTVIVSAPHMVDRNQLSAVTATDVLTVTESFEVIATQVETCETALADVDQPEVVIESLPRQPILESGLQLALPEPKLGELATPQEPLSITLAVISLQAQLEAHMYSENEPEALPAHQAMQELSAAIQHASPEQELAVAIVALELDQAVTALSENLVESAHMTNPEHQVELYEAVITQVTALYEALAVPYFPEQLQQVADQFIEQKLAALQQRSMSEYIGTFEYKAFRHDVAQRTRAIAHNLHRLLGMLAVTPHLQTGAAA